MPVEYCIPIPSIFTTPFDPLLNEELVVEQMEPLSRFEVSGTDMVEADPKFSTLFDKIGRGSFFNKFDGHQYQITRQVVLNIREDVARVGCFHVIVNKDSIAEATNFPQMGE